VTERVKPRLRGVFHEWAFFLAIPLGVALVLAADTTRARAAAAAFALSVVTMFGASALYHIPDWTPGRRAWLRRLDHAGIYCLIAGSYTPIGLLVLHGAWQTAVLAIVWSGCATAILIRLFWITAPKWLSAVVAILLGWVGVVALPKIVTGAGWTCMFLILGGGILYSGPSWKILVGYGYGVDAMRSHGRGAQSVGILVQFDLGHARATLPESTQPGSWRGFQQLFNVFGR